MALCQSRLNAGKSSRLRSSNCHYLSCLLYCRYVSWYCFQVTDDALNGVHYTDNITRSSTLPNNIHRINGSSSNHKIGTPLQTRFLPAYKPEQTGIIGNIQNRQNMMSSPAYLHSRRRHDSQSSAHSHRISTLNRVTPRHMPAHLDKRMARSRSVGIIPDSELKMRRTASASIVKLADCEDWIV